MENCGNLLDIMIGNLKISEVNRPQTVICVKWYEGVMPHGRQTQTPGQVRNKLRAKHYSYRTEKQYIAWIRRFTLHNGKRHPRETAGAEVERFLTYLAVDRRVSASTQNQALAAILFLYRQVLEIELPWLANVVRARRPARLPVVLSSREVESCCATSMVGSS